MSSARTTSPLRIAEGRDCDGPALTALIEPIFAEYPGVLFVPDEMAPLASIATSFARAGGKFWCAWRGERLVGCVGFAASAGQQGIELQKLYVAKNERRHRLGHRLSGLVEDAARKRGVRFVELWSDVKFTAAHAFYEARGYRRDGRTRALGDASHTVEYYFRLTLPAAHDDRDSAPSLHGEVAPEASR